MPRQYQGSSFIIVWNHDKLFGLVLNFLLLLYISGLKALIPLLNSYVVEKKIQSFEKSVHDA